MLPLGLPRASALATRTPVPSPAPLTLSPRPLGLGTTASGLAGALAAARLPLATLRRLALRRAWRLGRRSRLP